MFSEFNDNGSVKPIDYRAGAIESSRKLTSPAGLPFSQVSAFIYNKITGDDKYTENDFQYLARNAPNRNSADTAGSSFIDAFVDKFDPTDIANNLLDKIGNIVQLQNFIGLAITR